ncbi:MAG: phospholipase [Muribaculaceae bacterium]|nr:phospholipase [Muribaculaceae bacterium]
MILSLYIFLTIVSVGLVLWLGERRWRRNHPAAEGGTVIPEPETASEEACCGMHITCERDSLLAAVSPDIVYYDDEDLDEFKGRPADDYSPAETERFRDVLLTLLPDDIAGWARSLQLRAIELPGDVRDELLMIVSEVREQRAIQSRQNA